MQGSAAVSAHRPQAHTLCLQLDGNNPNRDIRIVDKGSIKLVWYPVLGADGKPKRLRSGIDTTLYFQFNDQAGVPSMMLLVVNASVVEASAEQDQRWLPKWGAAFFQTKGVELYAPHGLVRITAAADYVRPLPVGVMFTLGFSG